jgi:DNA-binding response OmpR family regulator
VWPVLKVLIAEDDFMIADLIEDCLIEAGYTICGIARTVSEGVALGRLHRPDLAIIDMRLADGGLGSEIVAQLHDGPRIGVLFASGNINQVIEVADGDACISKPYHSRDLLRALKIVEEIVNDGAASSPFPVGFQLLNTRNSSWQLSHG